MDIVSPHDGVVSPSPVWSLMTGTASKYLLLGVNLALGLFLMPFSVRHLGTQEYGLWMLIASMTAYFQLLDLGYGSGLVRHVAEADARGDVPLANRILSTFLIVYAGIGLLAAVGVTAMVVWVVPRFPGLSLEQVWRAQVVLGLMGARMAVGFPMTVFGAATTARQRFALNNAVAIGVALVNGLVTYLVLASGHGLLSLVASTTGVALASYAAYVWTATRAFPELRLRASAFSSELIRDITSFSMYLFVIDVAIQIGFNLDNLVIGAALGTTAVAIYAVTLRIADFQRQLCNQFNTLLFPVVVRLSTAGRTDALRGLLIDGTRIALTLGVGVTVSVIAFAAPLIERWMGRGFEGSVIPLYVLAVTGVVLVGQGPLGNILLGSGRHRLVAFTSLAEALGNLALSLVLVRRYGLVGVAVGTAVPIVVANLAVLVPAACRQVDIRVADFVKLVCVAPAVGAVFAALAAVVVRQSWPVGSIAAIFAQGGLVGLVYLVAVCAFGLDRQARARYLEYLRRIVAASPIGRVRAAHV